VGGSAFCVYCGVESSAENPVINGVCLRCRLERNMLVKTSCREIKVDMCKHCFSVRSGYKWVETTGFTNALDFVIKTHATKCIEPGEGVEELSLSSYEFVTTPSWRTVVRMHFKGRYRGVEFTTPVEIVVHFNPVKCPRCVVSVSGEYEAVLQLRGLSRNDIEHTLNSVLNSMPGSAASLIDIVEVRGGVNIYLRDKGAARKLAKAIARVLSNNYRVTVEESFEEIRAGSDGRARLAISIRVK